ncbi:hypothetical protein PMIN01_05099 [Paraphaeosphaeria minitans]|uniref:Uncharacterized protein n=1 Tax=Paraphaeosphaeria minitans TaxID=565426 RepID=A0A9P6KSJ9_9PLEO|nr:hypothetical protein PMIN01_05099 [Paraphaeosphaeria minitans]
MTPFQQNGALWRRSRIFGHVDRGPESTVARPYLHPFACLHRRQYPLHPQKVFTLPPFARPFSRQYSANPTLARHGRRHQGSVAAAYASKNNPYLAIWPIAATRPASASLQPIPELCRCQPVRIHVSTAAPAAKKTLCGPAPRPRLPLHCSIKRQR